MPAKAVRATRNPAESASVDADGELFDRLLHDLRNPLGVLGYYAEAIGDSTDAERPELCERLRINAQRTLHVLETFALIADLRRGRADPGDDPWTVLEVAREVVGEVEATERASNTVAFSGDTAVRVRGDRLRWACALRSLLRELVRGGRGQGPVRLHCSRRGAQVVVALTVPTAAGDEALRMELPKLELELVERLAKLSGGAVRVEREPAELAISIRLPAPR